MDLTHPQAACADLHGLVIQKRKERCSGERGKYYPIPFTSSTPPLPLLEVAYGHINLRNESTTQVFGLTE